MMMVSGTEYTMYFEPLYQELRTAFDSERYLALSI